MNLLIINSAIRRHIWFPISVWRQLIPGVLIVVQCLPIDLYKPNLCIFPLTFSPPVCGMSMCAVWSLCIGSRGGTVHKIDLEKKKKNVIKTRSKQFMNNLHLLAYGCDGQYQLS